MGGHPAQKSQCAEIFPTSLMGVLRPLLVTNSVQVSASGGIWIPKAEAVLFADDSVSWRYFKCCRRGSRFQLYAPGHGRNVGGNEDKTSSDKYDTASDCGGSGIHFSSCPW